ncbi:Enhancer of rudimentary [Carpediemonas membranifera]|uniref:Enhancer of rudimentary n=1 Tax=Carpediemonas membranifera TaxID=201153 RepID=A0A8J6AWR0_9EUKA|nr:Enhancer of rudimentary [Carpediemonas membranifera]|eukprot:KAG9390228.1 Enhancer of rudimentary [Carpediemonas membranifera]
MSLIFLIQTTQDESSRRYYHYVSLEDFAEGAVTIYEENLAKRNEGVKSRVIYDLGDISNFYATIPDAALLIREPRLDNTYVPQGPHFIVDTVVRYMRRKASQSVR